jgi:hypothetical protein
VVVFGLTVSISSTLLPWFHSTFTLDGHSVSGSNYGREGQNVTGTNPGLHGGWSAASVIVAVVATALARRGLAPTQLLVAALGAWCLGCAFLIWDLATSEPRYIAEDRTSAGLYVFLIERQPAPWLALFASLGGGLVGTWEIWRRLRMRKGGTSVAMGAG